MIPCARPIDKLAKQTPEVIGTSPRKVERTRTILDHADEEIKEKADTSNFVDVGKIVGTLRGHMGNPGDC
jgi:hypothetical protein